MPLFKRKKEDKKEEPADAKALAGKEEKTESKLKGFGLPEGKEPKLYKIIEKSVMTEKAVNLSENGKYVFKVSGKTNKPEIRKAVERLYDVKVKDVRIINTVGKKRQVGRFEGFKPGYKKAIVTLKPGYKIEISHA